MPSNKKAFNIAFEVSPILAASGSFGDKSGVFRLKYNLIKYLSNYLLSENLPHQIYLYTLNPSLNFNVSTDMYELLSKENVHFLKTEYIHGRLLQDYGILDLRGLRFFIKRIDKFFYQKVLESNVWEKYVKKLNQLLKEKNVSLVHHSESGFTQFFGMKSVIHINDLVALKFPFWQRDATIDIHRRKLKFAAKYCDGVICISENTKNDFFGFLKGNNLDYPNTQVIPLAAEKFSRKKEAGFSYINQYVQSLGYKALKRKKYFFYFGTIEPRKNTAALISVFDSLYRSNKINDFQLVLMGGKGWGKVYQQTVNYLKENYPLRTSSPIILLDFMADEFLATVIENAACVVYPSVYEGFGLPVIESMSLGTPVITSDSSSIPEVAGKACFYIDPQNPDSLKEALVKIATSEKLRNQLSKKGLARAKQFSWNIVAKETFEFYESLI